MKELAALRGLQPYVAAVAKRAGLVGTTLTLALLTAVVFNYTSRPLYQATAQILIDRDAPNVLPVRETVEGGQGSSELQTQYQLLKGRALGEKVVQRLGLNKSTEFQTGPLMSPWERIQRLLGHPPAATVDVDGIPLSPAVAAFRSRLVVQPIPNSRLINLRFSAYDPKVAAQAVNALAQVFIEQSMEFRFTTSTEATGWLGERIKDQKAKLEVAERALQDYREKERLVNLEEKQTLVDQKLQTLNGAAMSARTERISKETTFNQMRALPQSQLETFPLIMNSTLVQSLKTRRAEAQAEVARLAENLGEKHPDLIRARANLKDVESKLTQEIQNIIVSIESDYRNSSQQEANLVSNLEATKAEALDLNRKAIQWGILSREVESNQQLYRELGNRAKETGLESELQSTNVRIVEKAQVPGAPISPNRKRNYQLALLVGLGLGIALSLLFERLDNTFKTPDDVKRDLKVPFLGLVPDANPTGSNSRLSPLLHKNPPPSVTEAYRVLRTNLIFSSASTRGRVIVVSSASPGEGKTTTAANLAESLAQNGARVLLMDADLRRPTLHRHFGISKMPGLSDLIVGKSPPSQTIQPSRTRGLQLIPCGYEPPNPAELLGSDALKKTIEALREHYDWVILDSPPILGMADTSVLCTMSDGIVLVIGAEMSHRPMVQRALEQVASVGGKTIGAVLNRVDLARNAYYYGQQYGEYYKAYTEESSVQRAAGAAGGGPRAVKRS